MAQLPPPPFNRKYELSGSKLPDLKASAYLVLRQSIARPPGLCNLTSPKAHSPQMFSCRTRNSMGPLVSSTKTGRTVSSNCARSGDPGGGCEIPWAARWPYQPTAVAIRINIMCRIGFNRESTLLPGSMPGSSNLAWTLNVRQQIGLQFGWHAGVMDQPPAGAGGKALGGSVDLSERYSSQAGLQPVWRSSFAMMPSGHGLPARNRDKLASTWSLHSRPVRKLKFLLPHLKMLPKGVVSYR
jgi:hypothetical protein